MTQPLQQRDDWVLFRNLGTLGQKAGVPVERLPRLVARELVDNALDAGSACHFGELDGGFFVDDVFLHPDGFRFDADGGVYDLGNILRLAKDVYYVDGYRHVFEGGIDALSQNLCFLRIDGDDPVSHALHVFGHTVAGAPGRAGEPDYSYRFRAS